MAAADPRRSISFGPFEFDPSGRLLYRGDEETLLPPRTAAVLEALLRAPGEVLTHDDLLDDVWRDTFVSENSLTKAISMIRRAIGDDARDSKYVQTVPKRGYRFIAEVAPARVPGGFPAANLDAAENAIAGADDAPLPRTLNIGDRVGVFEIRGEIGSGAMGRVFRAWDTVLEREVAIKIPAGRQPRTPDQLALLQREWKLLAAVTHPNIAAIYGVEGIDDTKYPVLEMVDGETLQDRLRRGRLPLADALRIAAQVASALDAAHQRGIVHRDVKPANIKVSPDGQAKVLDFGLAKAVEVSVFDADDPDPGESMTIRGSHRGSIVGTAAYMSPEQARGRGCDTRADIWAFGCVLFEMLTGRRPFAGETVTGTIGQLLEREPDWGLLPDHTPAEIRSLLRLCLAKDPEERLRDVADARIEIAPFVSAGPGAAAVRLPAGRPAERLRSPTGLVTAGVAAVILLVLGWFGLPSPNRPPPMTTPLTSYPGLKKVPALSYDGDMLAFTRAASPGDPFDLYVKMITGGDPVLVSAGEGDVYDPAWAPGGDRIAFIRNVKDDGSGIVDAVYVVSPLGTGERELCRFPGELSGLSWAPDGESLALAMQDASGPTTSIYLLTPEGCGTTKLTNPPPGFEGDFWPRFSPNGELVAFRRLRVVSEEDLWVVPVTGGPERQVTTNNANIRGLDWAPEGGQIIFSTLRPGSPDHFGLWSVSADGGEPSRLPFGEQAQFPRVARAADRLVYQRVHEDWEIRRIVGPAAPGEANASEIFISSTWVEIAPSYSPGGHQVAFVSARSGDFEVWMRKGSDETQLTRMDDISTGTLGWSPDGVELAFISKDVHFGTYDVWVASASGGRPRRLTSAPGNEMAPSWSRDGRWIYYFSEQEDRREVWKIPAAGGRPIQVTHNGGTISQESPDGRSLYFAKGHYGNGPDGIWRISLEGGEEQRVIEGVAPYSWAVFEDGIVYFDRHAPPHGAFALYRFEDGSVIHVVAPDVPAVDEGISVSPDGRWILYVAHEIESDIMLVEGLR